MTVQLVHFGVGEPAGVRSTAAWTGLTFASIRKDSKSHRNKKLPTAHAWSIDRHVPPPVGHMMGGMECLDCDDTGPCLRGESSKNRVESWTNWLSTDEPGFMFLCGVDGSACGPFFCLSNIHGVTPLQMMLLLLLHLHLPPLVTSLQPLRCASSCVAPSDPTVRSTCAQKRNRERLVSGAAEEVCFMDGAKCCC